MDKPYDFHFTPKNYPQDTNHALAQDRAIAYRKALVDDIVRLQGARNGSGTASSAVAAAEKAYIRSLESSSDLDTPRES